MEFGKVSGPYRNVALRDQSGRAAQERDWLVATTRRDGSPCIWFPLRRTKISNPCARRLERMLKSLRLR